MSYFDLASDIALDLQQEDRLVATATYVPVETYLRSSYEPDAEYVDGEIEQRPMGEHDHASWQAAIQRWFLSMSRNGTSKCCPNTACRLRRLAFASRMLR